MKLRLVILLSATVLISSCGRTMDAGLAGKGSPKKRENPSQSGPSRPTNEEMLKKLRAQVILNEEFTENLEAAFAVHVLEKAMNGRFKVQKDKTELLKHLGVDQNANSSLNRFANSSIPYGVFAALVGMSSGAAADKSIGPVNPRTFPFTFSLENLRTNAIRSAFSSGALLAIPSLLLARTALIEKIGLSQEERESLTKQLKSGKFPNAMQEILKFLQLTPEDGRELEGKFVKAVIAVYDRSFVDSVKEVAANDFFMRLDKEVDFFKIAKEFKPAEEPANFRERLDFLEQVHLGLVELSQTSMENLSKRDSVDLRLTVYRAYQEAIKSFENDSELRKEKCFENAKKMINERVAILEELNEKLPIER